MSHPPPALALRVLLLGTLAVVAWLVSPFADALLVAAVAAVLAWPLRLWVGRVVRGPKAVATALTLLLVSVCVVVPVGGLIWLVSTQLSALARQLAAELDGADLSAVLDSVLRVPLIAWALEQAGGAVPLTDGLHSAARDGLLNAAKQLGQYVPGLVGGTARVVVKVAIFYVALSSFFHRGSELGAWSQRMSPLSAEHTKRLFDVFAEFARNVVLAGIVTAMVQGVVAGVGYGLAGVERPVLFAVLTGVLAFVPLIGTAAAWGPVALLLFLQGHRGAALFVVIWSVTVTGTVDNIIKPLIVRGRSDMPALLVFLGVFGGLLAFGVIGILVGPVLMALLLALLHIYEETVTPSDASPVPLGPPGPAPL